eukprot:365213-Chlamydomonas_euryale.AAC.4
MSSMFERFGRFEHGTAKVNDALRARASWLKAALARSAPMQPLKAWQDPRLRGRLGPMPRRSAFSSHFPPSFCLPPNRTILRRQYVYFSGDCNNATRTTCIGVAGRSRSSHKWPAEMYGVCPEGG